MPRKRSRGNGEGSIRRRPSDGLWEARYTVGQQDGRQVRRSVYGRTRAEAAQKLRDKIAVAGTLPRDPSAQDLSLCEYLARVAAGRVGHVSVKTSELDRLYVGYARAAAVGNTKLRDVSSGQLEEWYHRLALTHSKSTVQHTRVFVNLSLRQAVRRGHLLHHPGLVTELPKMKSTPVAQTLDAAAVRRLLEAATGTDLYLFLYLALSLGLRHGELLGLQWGDIDAAAGTLRIARAVTVDAQGAAVVTGTKTAASRRTLYLTSAHLALLSQARTEASSPLWVFSTPAGSMKNQNNVRRSYRRLLKAAGLDSSIRVHDLRHTFATHLIGAGHDPKTVSDLMGHTDPRLTLMIYTHTQDETRKRAALTASELVAPPAAKELPPLEQAVGVE